MELKNPVKSFKGASTAPILSIQQLEIESDSHRNPDPEAEGAAELRYRGR